MNAAGGSRTRHSPPRPLRTLEQVTKAGHGADVTQRTSGEDAHENTRVSQFGLVGGLTGEDGGAGGGGGRLRVR
jgi:hypothetical protein